MNLGSNADLNVSNTAAQFPYFLLEIQLVYPRIELELRLHHNAYNKFSSDPVVSLSFLLHILGTAPLIIDVA